MSNKPRLNRYPIDRIRKWRTDFFFFFFTNDSLSRFIQRDTEDYFLLLPRWKIGQVKEKLEISAHRWDSATSKSDTSRYSSIATIDYDERKLDSTIKRTPSALSIREIIFLRQIDSRVRLITGIACNSYRYPLACSEFVYPALMTCINNMLDDRHGRFMRSKNGKTPRATVEKYRRPWFLPSFLGFPLFQPFFFFPSFMFRPWSNQSRCRGWKTWNEFVKNASSRASLSKRESIYGIFGVLGRGGGHYSRAGTKIKEGNTNGRKLHARVQIKKEKAKDQTYYP